MERAAEVVEMIQVVAAADTHSRSTQTEHRTKPQRHLSCEPFPRGRGVDQEVVVVVVVVMTVAVMVMIRIYQGTRRMLRNARYGATSVLVVSTVPSTRKRMR